MAKQTRNQKVNHLQTHQGRGVAYEQSESYDDSLLPDANELAKLKELDPNIIEWIKERTAKEQDARISFNNRKMALIEGSTTKSFALDIITLIVVVIIILGGMAFSAYLISKDLKVEGTVFGGVVVIAIVNSVLNFRKHKPIEKKPPVK
ncbi:hypothetical protein [Mucilaginibacter sp. L196]|uniref:hypothetical protein n=1 Tax=Mucilaginibacter sp. L196 TaxID=1641870 RepID=UPI00131E06F8|nr:hypothetical protein [Mucilaginibacter sp. L196]